MASPMETSGTRIFDDDVSHSWLVKALQYKAKSAKRYHCRYVKNVIHGGKTINFYKASQQTIVCRCVISCRSHSRNNEYPTRQENFIFRNDFGSINIYSIIFQAWLMHCWPECQLCSDCTPASSLCSFIQ